MPPGHSLQVGRIRVATAEPPAAPNSAPATLANTPAVPAAAESETREAELPPPPPTARPARSKAKNPGTRSPRIPPFPRLAVAQSFRSEACSSQSRTPSLALFNLRHDLLAALPFQPLFFPQVPHQRLRRSVKTPIDELAQHPANHLVLRPCRPVQKRPLLPRLL